ncbi:MAG: hypothetical protein Q7W30_07780 [Coriobacteriia bacterium]|nr:hypothetical protein [Coriobacteriia bacterium]
MVINVVALFAVIFLALLGKVLLDVVKKAFDGAVKGSWWDVVNIAACVGLALFVPAASVFSAFGVGTLGEVVARAITGILIAGGAARIYRLLKDARAGAEAGNSPEA